MALTEKLAILITGDASGAISEMKKLATESEKNLSKTGGDVSKFSQHATRIGAGMVGVGTGLLATALSAASTTTELGKEVSKLQRYTGMTAESASKLAYAAKMSGVDVDSLAIGIGKLSKTMASTPDKLTKFGVEAKTSDGKLRGMSDVLGDVAEKIKTMGPGTAATAASLELFGRSGANLLPFLLKGREGITELSAEAEKMGLVLSQDNVDAVKKNVVAQRELKAAISGAKVQIGNEMLPILTKFTELVTGIPAPVRDIIGPVVVLGGAVLVTGGAFLLMAGQVQKARTSIASMSASTKTAGVAFTGLATGIALSSVLLSKMDAQFASARDKVSAGLDSSRVSAALAGYDSLTSAMQSNYEQAYKIDTGWMNILTHLPDAMGMKGTRTGLMEVGNSLSEMKSQADGLSSALGITKDAATVWLGKMAESGVVFPNAQAAVDAYTGVVAANKEGTEDAASAQDGYAASIKHAADVLRGTTDPIFAVMSAQDSLTEAQVSYDKIKNDGTKTDAEKEQALRKLWQASFDLTDAQSKLGQSMAAGDVTGTKLAAALDTLRLNNIDPTTEAGRKLSEKILGVEATSAAVAALLRGRVLRVETDEASLAATKRRLDEISSVVTDVQGNHRIVVNVDVNDPRRVLDALGAANQRGGQYGDTIWVAGRPMIYTGAGLADSPDYHQNADGTWAHNASGGFIPQGRPTLVGELGPELFIPSSSGTVMTSLSTANALSGGGSGVTIQHLSVALPNVTNGDQLVDELQRYIRRNGPLPLAVAS